MGWQKNLDSWPVRGRKQARREEKQSPWSFGESKEISTLLPKVSPAPCPRPGETLFPVGLRKAHVCSRKLPFCLNWLQLDQKPHCPYCPSILGPNDPCSGKTSLILSARVTISCPVFQYYHIPLYHHNHPKQPRSPCCINYSIPLYTTTLPCTTTVIL